MKNFKTKIGAMLFFGLGIMAPHWAIAQIPTFDPPVNIQTALSSNNRVKEAAAAVKGMLSNSKITKIFGEGSTMAATLFKKAKATKEKIESSKLVQNLKKTRDNIEEKYKKAKEKTDGRIEKAKEKYEQAKNKAEDAKAVQQLKEDYEKIQEFAAKQEQKVTELKGKLDEAEKLQSAINSGTATEEQIKQAAALAKDIETLQKEAALGTTSEDGLGMVNDEFLLPAELVRYCANNVEDFNAAEDPYNPPMMRACLDRLIFDLRESTALQSGTTGLVLRGTAAIEEAKMVYRAIKQQLLTYQYAFSLRQVQEAIEFKNEVAGYTDYGTKSEHTLLSHMSSISLLNMEIGKLVNDLDKTTHARHLLAISTRFEIIEKRGNITDRTGNFAPQVGVRGTFMIPAEMIEYCPEHFQGIIDSPEAGDKLRAALENPKHATACLEKVVCEMNDDVSMVNEEAKKSFQLMNQQMWIHQYAAILKSYKQITELPENTMNETMNSLIEDESAQMMQQIEVASLYNMIVGKLINDSMKNNLARQIMVSFEYLGTVDKDSSNTMCKLRGAEGEGV